MNGTWTESNLFSFANSLGDPDAGVTIDNTGNLYGTTYYGGSQDYCRYGCGTVWEITP